MQGHPTVCLPFVFTFRRWWICVKLRLQKCLITVNCIRVRLNYSGCSEIPHCRKKPNPPNYSELYRVNILLGEMINCESLSLTQPCRFFLYNIKRVCHFLTTESTPPEFKLWSTPVFFVLVFCFRACGSSNVVQCSLGQLSSLNNLVYMSNWVVDKFSIKNVSLGTILSTSGEWQWLTPSTLPIVIGTIHVCVWTKRYADVFYWRDSRTNRCHLGAGLGKLINACQYLPYFVTCKLVSSLCTNILVDTFLGLNMSKVN